MLGLAANPIIVSRESTPTTANRRILFIVASLRRIYLIELSRFRTGAITGRSAVKYPDVNHVRPDTFVE